MFAYMKLNYGIITEEQLNKRRLRNVWEILLTVIILCIVAGGQSLELPVMENGRRDADRNVSDSVMDDEGIITGVSAGSGLRKEFEQSGEIRLRKMAEWPEVPQSGCGRYLQMKAVRVSVHRNDESAPLQAASFREEPSVSIPGTGEFQIPFYVVEDGTIPIPDISDLISVPEESGLVKGEQTVTPGKPGILIDVIEKVEQPPSSEDSVGSGPEDSADSTEKNETAQPDSSENTEEEDRTDSSEEVEEEDRADAPEDVEETDQPDSSENVEETDQPGSAEDLEETDQPDSSGDMEASGQTFFYGGFLCSASGMIIGCPDIVITDGVLRLPSGTECTGVAAGALDSLGLEVYEVYIPANIVRIEDGALDGLTELFYIQVHPDNPVYQSNNGILSKK